MRGWVLRPEVAMATSMLPAYAVLLAAVLMLAAALAYVSMRMLSRRQVTCPGDGEKAEVLVEFRKSSPWSQDGRERVVQCSHQPGGVTCNQACVNCDRHQGT